MSDIAIRVENLGKRYRIGERPTGYKTFRESLSAAVSRSARSLRKIFGRNGHESNGTRPGAFWALRDVSFEVKQGEVVGVIGRNGAGKSTLLKILSRITEPSEGQAILNGRVGSLLEVGTGFHPELTGRENIYLNGAIIGMRKAEINRHFDAITSFAEIDGFLDTPVKRYSTGMQLRLAFSVAAPRPGRRFKGLPDHVNRHPRRSWNDTPNPDHMGPCRVSYRILCTQARSAGLYCIESIVHRWRSAPSLLKAA
jgi:lipopolysaccharide transport system ATP-binding protein